MFMLRFTHKPEASLLDTVCAVVSMETQDFLTSWVTVIFLRKNLELITEIYFII